MSDEVADRISILASQLSARQAASDLVFGLEKKLELARANLGTLEASIRRSLEVLQEVLHPRSAKVLGEVYREQGVPGYEDYTR